MIHRPVNMLLVLAAIGCTADKDTNDTSDIGFAPNPNSDSDTPSPYTGGWPVNPDKDDLGDPPWDPPATIGAQAPHYTAIDQYGDVVDLYDFAGHGVPIIIDMGTIYCGPCKALASYLSDGDMSHLLWEREGDTGTPDYYPWWDEDYEGLRDMVANGEIYWLTILFNESASGPTDQEECATWHEEFPNPYIPVLADSELQMKTWLGIESYPTLNLLNSDMTLEIHSTGGPFEVLRHVGDMLAETK